MSLLELNLHRSPRFSHTRLTDALFSFAMRAAALRRQRMALRRLDDRALADIGLTRRAAEIEAGRPFWDVPATWTD